MLALSNLPKHKNEKTTKILKPWLNVINDYLVILLLTVPIFVGGIELTSGRYSCVPVVHCRMSNNDSALLSEVKYQNVCRFFYSSQKSTDTNGSAIIVVTKLKYTRDYDYVNSECRKTAFPSFHSYFSTLHFVEALILLLVNYLWLKNPWTASTVNSFYALVEECYNLPGAHFARLAHKIYQESVTTLPRHTSPYIPLNDFGESGSQRNLSETDPSYCQGWDSVDVDLATAVACTTLYEKIGRFNDHIKTSNRIWCLYLIQVVLQALLIVASFTVNFCLKDIKGTAKCSVDECFPVIYDYFTCSHNLSALLEQAWVVLLIILAVLFVICLIIACWAKSLIKEYDFEHELKGWRIPGDLKAAKQDMGFL